MTDKEWAPAPGDGASEVSPGVQEPLGGAGADPDEETKARHKQETGRDDESEADA